MTDVSLVAYAEKIGMEEGDVLHVSNGFKNKGGLPCPALSLHDYVLAGLYARGELALECRTRAEEVSVDSASVSEWVHVALLSLVVVPIGIVPKGVVPFGTTRIV